MYSTCPCNKKCKFVDLFTDFDTESLEIQTPRRNECVVSTKTISAVQMS